MPGGKRRQPGGHKVRPYNSERQLPANHHGAMGRQTAPESPPRPSPAPPGPTRRRSGGGFFSSIADDLGHFSAGRAWTVARLAVSETLRLHVLGVIALGLAAVVLADVTSKRFDPVFDTAASLIRISELTILLVGIIFAIFLSTYSLPREIVSKTIYSLVTKPVSRLEIVLGKTVGVMVVLGAVTFGLGLLCLGYMHFRGGQVASMAATRIEEARQQDSAGRLETDVPPVALQSIAERGPFVAAAYQLPSEDLTIISGAPIDQSMSGRGYTWLTGYPTHRAHWGFDDLPAEEIDGGKAVVRLKVAFGDAAKGPPPADRRQVLVRLVLQTATGRTLPSVLATLGEDGSLEVPIPAIKKEGEPRYTGQRLWVSLAGSGTPPLAVTNDSCVIALSSGTTVSSLSGVLLTGEFQLGKYSLGGPSPEMSTLVGKVVFKDVPADRVGPGGTVLRVNVGLSSLGRNLPEARTRVITVVGEDKSSKREFTFRPAERAEQLIPLPREYFGGGTLSVFVRSEVEISLADEGIKLQTSSQVFAANWLTDLVLMWLSFSVLSGIGVLASTMAGWHVASMFTAVLFLIANVWPTAVANVRRYGLNFSGRTMQQADAFQRAIAGTHNAVLTGLGWVLPNFDRLDQSQAVVHGLYVSPWSALLGLPIGAVWYALFYLAATVALSYLLFLRKEVAS